MEVILEKGAILPTRAHKDDLGFDLFANEQITIAPGGRELVSTGCSIKFPQYWGGFIKDRSSVASKRGLFVKAGVIDVGYRGTVKILFYNSSDKIQTIYQGDKIAQLVLIPLSFDVVKEVDEFSNETERGESGFGSTN